MTRDYSALDAAILEHIRSWSPVHPMYAEACRKASKARVGISVQQIIANRLSALRKAGKIQHRRGAGHGWSIVEDPQL